MENQKQDKASLQTGFRVRESVTCGEGVSTPHNARPKTVPLIK